MFSFGNVKFTPGRKNVPVLWPSATRMVSAYARKVLDAADPGGSIGYTMSALPDPRRRAGAIVTTHSVYARRHNAKHQTLERALDGARD